MNSSSSSGSGRRDFLARVATAGVVMAGGALVSPIAQAGAQPATQKSSSPFDDSWTSRVTAAKHKAVFDSPGVEDGLALMHATFFMQGYHEQFDTKPGECVPVVVLRHVALPMALNDTLWDKYALGERTRVKDPLTKADARRNPFAHRDDRSALVVPDATIEGLLASGVVVLACNK